MIISFHIQSYKIRAKSLRHKSMKRSDFEEASYESDTDFDPILRFSPPKQQKIDERAVETLKIDRISELPDAILVRILSLLSDTESAIRTGTLSRRWQFVWTTIPILRFCFNSGSISDFNFFVDKTLLQCGHSRLKKLTIDVDGKGNCFPSLKAWIRYAVSCNVEDLELSVPYPYVDQELVLPKFEVPVHLFTNSFLINLKLRACFVVPSSQISWKMLKMLSLRDVRLNEDVFQNILLGSPVLQHLRLHECEGFTRLDVNSTSLEEVIVDGYSAPLDDNDIILKISGPNLLSLEIKGIFVLDKIELWNMPSLLKVTLDFHSEGDLLDEPDMWYKILENISNAKELTIGNLALQALSYLELDGRPSALSKRTCLKTNFIRRSFFPGLANLLQSSPYLERLYIDSCRSYPWGGYARKNYLTYRKRRFDCIHHRLKFAKICYLIEEDDNHKCELGRFLLENANVLEKMIVNVGSRHICLDSKEKLLQESRKYLSFPRASKKAVVLIEGQFKLRNS